MTEDVEVPRQRGHPDDVLVDYGADAFRLYEMFMGRWNGEAVEYEWRERRV